MLSQPHAVPLRNHVNHLLEHQIVYGLYNPILLLRHIHIDCSQLS